MLKQKIILFNQKDFSDRYQIDVPFIAQQNRDGINMSASDWSKELINLNRRPWYKRMGSE